MLAQAHAKVNLTLSVGPRGDDGYHQLSSIFLRIGLADELTVGPAPGAGRDLLTVAGPPDVPIEGNLVLHAFAALRRAVGHGLPPLVAHLEKRIPMAAGLGGGSSDGAAALDAALAAWGVDLPPAQRAELALNLGSDVPFFASGAPVALVHGRGERVTPLRAIDGELGFLLATGRRGLLTAAVFREYDTDRQAGGDRKVSDSLAIAIDDGLDGHALLGWADRLRATNDLWPAARRMMPELAAQRRELERSTARPWLLSGSGPTLFALYPSLEEAHAAGVQVVTAASALLGTMTFQAVDLEGRDAVWRYP